MIEVLVIFLMFGEIFTLEGQPSNGTAWKRRKDSLNSTGVAERSHKEHVISCVQLQALYYKERDKLRQGNYIPHGGGNFQPNYQTA